MTETLKGTDGPGSPRIRWSNEHVRALVWIAGGATFFTGVAVAAAAPGTMPASHDKAVKAAKQAPIARKVSVVSTAGHGRFAPVHAFSDDDAGQWQRNGNSHGHGHGDGEGHGGHGHWQGDGEDDDYGHGPGPSPLPSPSVSPTPSPSPSPVCTTSPTGVTTCV
jgi:hypothetical protein